MEKLSIKQTRQISSYQAEVKVAIAGLPVDISKAINIGIKSNNNYASNYAIPIKNNASNYAIPIGNKL